MTAPPFPPSDYRDFNRTPHSDDPKFLGASTLVWVKYANGWHHGVVDGTAWAGRVWVKIETLDVRIHIGVASPDIWIRT